MPSIMKKSCVSAASGAEPQISAFRLGPMLFRIVGNIDGIRNPKAEGIEKSGLFRSRAREIGTLARERRQLRQSHHDCEWFPGFSLARARGASER